MRSCVCVRSYLRPSMCRPLRRPMCLRVCECVRACVCVCASVCVHMCARARVYVNECVSVKIAAVSHLFIH